jgi:hypothetical protein
MGPRISEIVVYFRPFIMRFLPFGRNLRESPSIIPDQISRSEDLDYLDRDRTSGWDCH